MRFDAIKTAFSPPAPSRLAVLDQKVGISGAGDAGRLLDHQLQP